MSLQDQPENLNFLSPIGFRFNMTDTPHINYFAQSATLPSITLGDISSDNTFIKLPMPGDKLVYEPFELRFRVDEDLKNYMEIHDWLIGMGAPENFTQYANLVRGQDQKNPNLYLFKDGSLSVLDSNKNVRLQFSFTDMFPISLTPLPFDVTLADVEFLECTVTFRYRKFEITRL